MATRLGLRLGLGKAVKETYVIVINYHRKGNVAKASQQGRPNVVREQVSFKRHQLKKIFGK